MQGIPSTVRALLTRSDPWPCSERMIPTGEEKRNIRNSWAYLLEKVILQRGPFSETRKSDNLDKLIGTAVKLFPWGIPSRYYGWRCAPYLVESTEYEDWLKQIFNRTVPTPISDLLGQELNMDLSIYMQLWTHRVFG